MIKLRDIQRVKETYLPGMRVRLVKMDDIQAPLSATEGTILGVDDTGSVMVRWDTGSGLHVLLGIDEVEIIDDIQLVFIIIA